MRGHDDLVQARLERWPVGGVDIVVGGVPGFDRRGKAVWFYLVPEGDGAIADLRGCHGLPVFVHAPSYEAGYPVFERAIDFSPLFIALCYPTGVVRYDGAELTQWES